MKICLNCNKEITKRSAKIYCNNKCQAEYKYKKYIERWKSGLEDGVIGDITISKHLRKYILDKYDSKCCKCGWAEVNVTSGKIPLEIEHIDGNWRNNKEDNLELLCPNCHSLTSTYGILNKGNGRRTNARLV